jgi:hypothetical protein
MLTPLGGAGGVADALVAFAVMLTPEGNPLFGLEIELGELLTTWVITEVASGLAIVQIQPGLLAQEVEAGLDLGTIRAQSISEVE